MAKALLASVVILLLLICAVDGGGGYGGRRGRGGGHHGGGRNYGGSNSHSHESNCNSSNEDNSSEDSDGDGEYHSQEDGGSEEDEEIDGGEITSSIAPPECLPMLRTSLTDWLTCLGLMASSSTTTSKFMEDTTARPTVSAKPLTESEATSSQQQAESDLSKMKNSPLTQRDRSKSKLKDHLVVGGIIAAVLVVVLVATAGIFICCCHKSTNKSRVAASDLGGRAESYVEPQKEAPPAYVSTDLDIKKGDLESGLTLTSVQPPPVVQLTPPSYSSIDVREDPPRY